jgi:hypothetical protein
MKATFFIIPESFKYNGDTQSNIEEKLKNFAIDLRRIKETPGNEIFYHLDIYNVEIFENKTICDVLYDPTTQLIDRNVFTDQGHRYWQLST